MVMLNLTVQYELVPPARDTVRTPLTELTERLLLKLSPLKGNHMVIYMSHTVPVESTPTSRTVFG